MTKEQKCTCGTCEDCCMIAFVRAGMALGEHLHKRGGFVKVQIKLSGPKATVSRIKGKSRA